jgi:hypothetical protein
MTDAQTIAPSGLYAFTDCELVNMFGGAALLMDKYSDAQMLAAPNVAQSMQLCRNFRTLEQHAQELTSSIPELAGQHADVMNVLTMFKEAGLLISAEVICEQLNADVPPAIDLPQTRVFAITCDRPEATERLLESMLQAGNLSRHEAIFLIDDSRNPDNAAKNREAVEQFNLTSPRDMYYFGKSEAAAFMAQLIEQQPDEEEAIRFLIDRSRWADKKTFGLARNLCLLLSVGHRAIIMDDDVLCTTMAAPYAKEGLEFGSTAREAGFYSDHQQMLSQTTPAGFDPLTGHSQCLGLNMGQATRKLAGRAIKPEDLAEANSSYLRLWQANSMVLVTQCGTLGDPGSPVTDWIYFAESDTARRLSNFSGGIQGALASRCYWLGHPRPCFSKVAVMSQITGLDNSQLLPPYFPVFRGEDSLFGAMTEYLHPNSTVLSYSWSVPHLPIEQRAGDPDPEPMSGKGMFTPGKFITDHTSYQPGVSEHTRLSSLASLLQHLAETDDRGLLSMFRKEVAELQGLDLHKLDTLLQNGAIRPPEWQSWLEQSASNVNQSMQQLAEITDIQGLPEGASAESLLEESRDYAAGFSGALSAWVAIRDAARKATGQITKTG